MYTILIFFTIIIFYLLKNLIRLIKYYYYRKPIVLLQLDYITNRDCRKGKGFLNILREDIINRKGN